MATLQQFWDKYATEIAWASQQTGIPAQAIAIQLGNESGNGSSNRAIADNNLGGIKYSAYSKVAIKKADGFARYKSVHDFFVDYVRVMSLSYYNDVRAAGKTGSVKDTLIALGKSPYDAGHYTDNGNPGSKLLAAMGITTPKPNPVQDDHRKPPPGKKVCPACQRAL